MQIIKISPGENAKYWKHCLENETHICVGWSAVGDLRRFESVNELRDAMKKYQYGGGRGPAASKAKELWIVRNLEHGDQVIAAKGIDGVVGVGTVTGRYRWNARHRPYPHIVPVDWDASQQEKKIPHQEDWRNTTVVGDISPRLFRLITGRRPPRGSAVSSTQDKEARTAVKALEAAKEKSSGQGFSGSPQVRSALEKHAMERARDYFRRRGFEIETKGKPYDLCCTRSRKELFVEVKGTQGRWEKVFLTRGEVSFARSKKRQMVLFVVHHINVDGNPQKPHTSGGTLKILNPWDIDAGKLNPIAYEYRLPES
jgi:hypothetical protein